MAAENHKPNSIELGTPEVFKTPIQAAPSNTPMRIAGGDLDPAITDAEVYIGTPRSATPPAGRACAVAARYVETVNNGDYAATAALFADDATFVEPMRPILRGRAQIDEFYTKRIGTMKPAIIAVAYQGDDRECLITLTTRIEVAGEPRWALVSVDHFILNDAGKVSSMVAFARPMRGVK